MSTRILIVEDDPSQQEIMKLLLQRKLGYESIPALGGRQAISFLQEDPNIRLVLLDIGLPDINGMEVLEMIVQRHPDLPVIILTGSKDINLAVNAMKAGAYDFLSKPVQKERLQVSVQNALKTSLLEKEVSRLKRQEQGAFTFRNLIGHDAGLTNVIHTGRKAAASDIPVLLTGETGTGKEAFAQAIHGESHRTGQPFIAVNCGAIPAQLVESTLFGHEKGAFTGAIAKSIGKFREAEGGSIFLDEIGDLPLEAQAKLLRVLQQKEINPVGAGKSVPVNVRIISATNRNLEADVANGRFREDLYFRLNVQQIHIPALRERCEDIPALAYHFIERFAAAESRSLKDISKEALEMFSCRAWPGNVRELENILHRAMVLCEKGRLDIEDFSALAVQMPANGISDLSSYLSLTGADGAPRPLPDIEREILAFSLKYYQGNITRAAAALSMAKSTFYRKLKELQ